MIGVSMKEQPIQVRKQDVLNFVLGNLPAHPIEQCLDSIYECYERYEAFDAFIYDSQLKDRAVQETPYISFMKEVDKLRAIILNKEKISKKEIRNMCIELTEMAPTTVNIPIKQSFVEPSGELAKLFGVDKRNFADFKGDASKETPEDRALRRYEEERRRLFGEEE